MAIPLTVRVFKSSKGSVMFTKYQTWLALQLSASNYYTPYVYICTCSWLLGEIGPQPSF